MSIKILFLLDVEIVIISGRLLPPALTILRWVAILAGYTVLHPVTRVIKEVIFLRFLRRVFLAIAKMH